MIQQWEHHCLQVYHVYLSLIILKPKRDGKSNSSWLENGEILYLLMRELRNYYVLDILKVTLQPTISSKDLSAKGYSKRPATNFTLSILSTASSILVIGISPDSARKIRSFINSLCFCPTITCIFLHIGK